MSTNKEQQGAYESNYAAIVKYEATVSNRAYELMKGWDPLCNAIPVFELIRQADKYGLDLVPKPKPTAIKEGNP